MNFLKVKKFMFAFLFSFFISCSFVSAKTLEGSIHTTNSTRSDYSSSINLFYETKNSTGFMNLLYSQGYNFGNYLDNYFGLGNSTFFNSKYEYGMSIMTFDEYKKYLQGFSYVGLGDYKTLYFLNDNSNDFMGISYENNSGSPFIYTTGLTSSKEYITYFETYYLNGYNRDSISYIVIFSTTNGLENSKIFGNFAINEDYSRLTLFPKYMFFFDINGTPIGYTGFGNSSDIIHVNNDNSSIDSNISMAFEFPFDDDKVDMTSWYSYAFKLDVSSSIYDKIYSEYFYLDDSGEYVKVSNNSGYSGISGWFNNIFSDYYELGHYNLEFIYDDVFYSGHNDYISLFDLWFEDTSYSVPDDYDFIDVAISKKGYYLVPQSGCSYDDYLLYYSGSSTTSIYALYFNYYVYDYNDSNFDISKKVGVFSSKAYVNYSYNPLLDLGLSVDEFLNYSINVYQYSIKYSYNLYFNSACYVPIIAADEDILLENDNYSYLLSSVQIQSNYNNDTVNGSNYVTGSTTPSQGSSNSNVANSSILKVDVDDVINNVPDYISSILSSISAIVGIFTIFFVGLPNEIYGFIMSVFVIGMIVLIIKLVRGG